ncbi:hypothetical protein NEMIN01_0477 [Nematocida minor]|uniref:uncharacterized protein n=1 Tax=Nematocida minor TaxID=1912983 RepID=UPI0022204EFF|nr:uncharacterized protein NEMIN01_0477 [Nematocida minor]KAI5189414.1 hypothetical protein NEMIN01_0477 [Nematocida minor]
MGLYVEVFMLYSTYILLFSLFNSSEDRVIVGRGAMGFLESIEVFIVHKFGCLIPYTLVCAQILNNPSLMGVFAVLCEMVVYIIIKDSVIVYIKDLKIFTSSCVRLPLNPSGHTFMFLNGIYILCPILYNDFLSNRKILSCLSGMVIYEYNRLLISTITYYHTFLDVALGVIAFLLFRALVNPVRSVYGKSAYTNEWGVQQCFFACIFVFTLVVISRELL